MLGSKSARVDRSAAAAELLDVGVVHLRAPHDSKELAWSCARAVFDEAARADAIGAGMPPLDVVGYFNVPPPDALRRDFQALHMDFGLPVVPDGPSDVARFTALYVDQDHAPTTALTRIVPLRQLLSQRAWIEPELLRERLRRYGQRNAGDGGAYIEGIFARLVEAADDSPTLPRSGDAGFLCGMEFASMALVISSFLLTGSALAHKTPQKERQRQIQRPARSTRCLRLWPRASSAKHRAWPTSFRSGANRSTLSTSSN
jgi:hypothetical protein